MDICHPKDANIFKNIIRELEKKGHTTKITVANKENTVAILEDYGFDYEVRRYYGEIASKAIGVLKNDIWLYKVSKKFKPDILLSGHIHEAEGLQEKIGKTKIISVGKKGKIIEI